MKVHLLTENLQKKLPFLNRAISTRSQLPILFNFLLETKNGKLRISSTDLEIGVQVEITANIEEEGEITVSAKVFSELISSLSSEKITLKTEGETLLVLTQKTKSTFQTISKEEFPNLYEEKGEKVISAGKKILDEDLVKVVFAASFDTGRPALSGVLIKKNEKEVVLVATDGYRLSLKYNQSLLEKASTEKVEQLLIPARVIREALSIKDQTGKIEVFIAKKNNQIIFEYEEIILIGRLIEAEYPAYEKIIPESFTTKFVFDREEMQKAVKLCSIFARDSANIIKFLIKKDKVFVSANMPSVGENTTEVDIKLEGEENEIAFNAKYVLDLLANIEEEEMSFEMTGSLNPGVFKIKGDNSFLHLIMPIRVQA